MSANSKQPSSKPILCLNTNIHTAKCNRISSDVKNTFILTCSHDKTGKLWNARNGKLIRTFRPPRGEGNEGKLYSCALSPDGTFAVFGGYTGYEWEDSYKLYFFDTGNGNMIRRATGMDNVIFDINFSPDGKYIAAALGGPNGIRIINAATGEVKKKIIGFEGDCYSVVFSPKGKLAAVSYDGYIRLFDNNFTIEHSKKTTGGSKPFNISFSSDGQRIAVAYEDSIHLQVLDAESLEVMYEPDISGLKEVSDRFIAAAFSPHGNFLYSGGLLQKEKDGKWLFVIRKYDDYGKGPYKDYPVGLSSIMHMKCLSEDSLLYCTSYPEFGILNPDGNIAMQFVAETLDLRAKDQSHLKVSESGAKIGFKSMYDKALTFSFNDRELKESEHSGKSPAENGGGVTVSDWKSSSTPKINDIAVTFLKKNEINYSVDISPRCRRICFGTSWSIYLTDYTGKVLCETAIPGAAFAVNITGNGEAVVAAMADGTLRWYSAENLKELLALYVHPDKKRWVLWTAGGYYDCSAGAEDLIGWHVNNGKDKEADFYPASRFHSVYYRPDVIDKILVTYDEDEAVRQADEERGRKQPGKEIITKLPPLVNIISPINGSSFNTNRVTLKFSIKTFENAPVTKTRVFINGSKAAEPDYNAENEINNIELTLPGEDCVITVSAENTHGLSPDTAVQLFWKGAVKPNAVKKNKLYILAIGISGYSDPGLKLQYAAKDAEDIAGFFKTQEGKLYDKVEARLLTESTANRSGVLDGLEWLERSATANDLAILFIGGHGCRDANGIYYFLPADADVNKIRSTCVVFSEVKNTVSAVAGKIIVFVDTCHSGSIMGGKRSVDINQLVNELKSAENSPVIFASSTGKQFSLEKPIWNNGAFTKAVVEGLKGKADLMGRDKVTLKSLDCYVTDRVKELTAGQQSPVTIIPEGSEDYAIAVIT